MSGKPYRRNRVKKCVIKTTLEQDVGLCELVGANPVLYDRSHENYKDFRMKDEIWKGIGAKLDLTGEVCKERWRNIKDTFKKKRIRSKLAGNNAGTPVEHRKWTLYDHIAFLEAAENERESVFNTADKGADENGGYSGVAENSPIEFINVTSLEENGLLEVLDHKVPKCEFYSSSEEETAPTLKKRKLKVKLSSKKRKDSRELILKPVKQSPTEDEFSHIEDEFPHVEDEFSHIEDEFPHINEQTEQEDTELFFKSMAMTAKSFQPHLLAELKKKICTLVMDTQIENDKCVQRVQYST